MAPSELSPEAKRALESLKRQVPATAEDERHTTDALTSHPVGHWSSVASRVDHSEQTVRHP